MKNYLSPAFFAAFFSALLPGFGAMSQEVNPADNPLIGTWTLTAGAYKCDQTRIFAEHTQSWIVDGKLVTAPATYAKSGTTIYVQVHTGSGGTVAFVVLSKDEIMDTLGTGACHWKRQ